MSHCASGCWPEQRFQAAAPARGRHEQASEPEGVKVAHLIFHVIGSGNGRHIPQIELEVDLLFREIGRGMDEGLFAR